MGVGGRSGISSTYKGGTRLLEQVRKRSALPTAPYRCHRCVHASTPRTSALVQIGRAGAHCWLLHTETYQQHSSVITRSTSQCFFWDVPEDLNRHCFGCEKQQTREVQEVATRGQYIGYIIAWWYQVCWQAQRSLSTARATSSRRRSDRSDPSHSI
jgi:hypothetical protein